MKISLWPFKPSADFTLGNSLFGTAELTKNADVDKYKYSGYGTGFDAHRCFLFVVYLMVTFGADMISSAHVDNRIKDIPILGKGSMRGLDNTTLNAEKEYTINFSEQQKKLCLSLHYNSVNSYLFVNGYKTYKFKAKDSEINATPLCLGNVSKPDNTKKKGLNGYVYDFSVDYDITSAADILDIHKYCSGLLNKFFIAFLSFSKFLAINVCHQIMKHV